MEHIKLLFILRAQDSGGIQFHIWTNKRIRYTSPCSSCMATFWSMFRESGMRVLHRVVNVKPCIRLPLELQFCRAKFVSFYKVRVCRNKRENANGYTVVIQWTGWSCKAVFTMERIIISRETCMVMAYVQMLYSFKQIIETKNRFV
jgi:hypothetical protein